MTTILVLFAHADPSVRAKYEAACNLPGGPRVIVVPFVGPAPGMSARYDRLGQQLRAAHGPHILDALVRRVAPGVAHDRLVLAWFSGGYAMGRQLSDADRSRLAAMIAIDGLHSGFDPNGAIALGGLEWIVDYARRAREGEAVCWIGHTDVQTPQQGAGAYASTTQTAREVVRIAGAPHNGLHVQAFDLRPATEQAREHGDALHVWGPEFLAGAIAHVVEQRGDVEQRRDVEPAPETPLLGPALGPLALERALAELADGVREEPPGSNGGRRIREYFAGCTRDGRPVGISSGEWCAAAASWCAHQATAVAGVQPVYGRRVAVRELVADALAAGAWRPASGGYVPQIGDLAILRRGAVDPSKGGIGHVGRVESVGAAIYVTVDGNAGVAWGRASRRFDDPQLVGWIAEPRGAATCAIAPRALALAATLRTRGDEAVEWLADVLA